MKVLLTGATGFIGKFVLQRLLENGHDVTSVVRSPVTSASDSIVVHGVLGSDDFIDIVLSQSEQSHAIVHVAACIDYAALNPELIKVNCLGMQQLLELAKEWKACTFVYVSGVPVIGTPASHPITESHETLPRTTYHATKLLGEHLLSQAACSDMAGASLRVTAPIGPGMPDRRALSTFVRRALENRPLLLMGRGTRRQNYVDVRDVADAVVSCIKEHAQGVFNIGGTGTTSNVELAEECIRVARSNSRIEFTGTADPADDEVWDVSIDAAAKALGYQPKHSLTSSIEAVMKQYESCDNQRYPC